MDKETLIQLIQELYRLTLFFPKKEPLRYKMREIATGILSDLVPSSDQTSFSNAKGVNLVISDLEILDGFFEVAKVQDWVSSNEVLKLQQEYSKLREDLGKSASGPKLDGYPIPIKLQKQEVAALAAVNLGNLGSLENRQQEILNFLREKGRAQVWEVKQIFPEISKRTLRRDFEQLLNLGAIERIGEKNDTSYQLKKVGQA